MKCQNCGAEIPNNSTECAFCDALVITEVQQTPSTEVQPQKQEIVETKTPANPLIGKEYHFVSSKGYNLRNLMDSRITSNVKVSDDRLFIDIKPKRLNTAPAVLFEDITGISISKTIRMYHLILIVITVIAGCAQIWPFLLTALVLFVGINQKITISQRSGVKVVMYARSKAVAEEFKNDMKQLAKIQ